MSEHNGWIGTLGQMLHALRTVGADTNDEGKFVVSGSINLFLGIEAENNDVVLGNDAKYLKGGVECSLVSLMGITSYGHKVEVIG